MPEHSLALLDTSCVIEYPQHLESLEDAAAISTLTVAELAYGLHHDDPLVAASRERRYREVLGDFDPVPYSSDAAHLTGRSLRPCESRGGTRDHAGST
jgi:predicted nucleic acid-binding protein